MGRRGYILTVLCSWIIILLINFTSGEGNPEPHPDPASALTGPGPHVNLPNPRIIEGPVDTHFAKHEPATLNCNAQGDPSPTITWYQNDQKIIFDSDNTPTYHRMMLPNGQLFFLRVIHTKTARPDVGIYYCKATNIHGSVTSNNATIKIAVIRDDFRQEPVDTTKPFHSTAILHCKPPRGEPEPKVTWFLNGKAISLSDRVQMHDDGDLVLSSVTTQDAGEYVCVAKNKAGERRSSPAQLTVLEVPQITRFPEDVTADEGETVEFHCQISGDPDVKWGWTKEGGAISQQRSRLLKDHTLHIENVEASDEGTYVCNAENDAGSVEAVAHLKVEYTPTFLVRPRNQAVAVGRTVTLQCSATGNPPPTIFWKSKSQDDLLFTNNAKGRFSVADDGTLRIERVEKADEGEYTCQALNSKGEAQASATVTVRENDFRPPPVIRFGPQNQTLPQEGLALLRCQATGSPEPLIRWYKHGRPLQMTDARYTLLDSGTLQISSLKIIDTGKYTCMAVSETGETTVDATLIVESQARSPTDPVKSPPDLKMFPGAPEKPVVSDVTDTTVRLSWQLLRDTGKSPVSEYQVEYFAYGITETWEVTSDSYTSTDVIIHGLVPNTTYVFLVRAKNSHGTGGPSPLSDLIRTLEKGEGHFITPKISLPRDQIEAQLPNVEVKLVRGEAVNSSAIRISWQVKNELGVVDGFMMQYKHILNMGDRRNLRYGDTQRKLVPYRPRSYTITGLKSYEYYEICVMAASGDKVSLCSSPMKIQSGESVPTSPPENVIIHRESDTEILVTWSPPSIEERKGEIIAYQIKCYSEDGTYNCSRVTNGSTHSARIDNLVAGVNYNIEIAAQTEKGVGKWSMAHSVGPEQADITKEPWFIGMIVAIGSILWLALCIFTIWLCRSRKQRKKLKEQWNGYTDAARASHKTLERNGNNVRKGYGVKDGSNDSGLPAEFSTLLQQSRQEDEEQNDTMYNMARDGTHPEMKTFFQKSGPVTPYATTTLLQAQAQNARKQSAEQMFRPITQGYHQHSGGSADSNTDRSNTTEVSIELRDSNHGNSTGDSGHLTDENGMLIKQYRKGCRPGGPQNQAIVNWSDVLPPPPIHPPNDGEYSQDEQLYSEIPEERARSPLSPVSVSQMSACSCPVSHSHQIPGYNVAPAYSDNCNRCQSLRNFENRPYSPQQMMQLQRQLGHPPNISRTLGAKHPYSNINNQRGGGTPVYLQGYQQPWDCQPLPRGPYEYDYAQVPREDGYNYTQPIQDGLIEHSNTLRGREKNKKIQPSHGPNIGEYQDSSVPHRGPYREVSNTPGGPPGNYCEGPYRGQVDALNNLNNYNRNRSDNSQMQGFEGYKIESLPSIVSASEYNVVGGGSQKSGSGGDSGSSEKGNFKGRSSSEGNDLKERQYNPEVEAHCRSPMYRSRSETSPPHHCMIDEGYSRNAESPISEDPDYAESDNGEERNNERDSMVANWESMEDCSSVHSTSSNAADDDDDGQFLNEEDFASAVARAAVMSGLTVVGTTVSADPSPKPVKKSKRHHRPVRVPSPGYSTDSNYGTADMIHKPYPKSERRKQLAEQGKQRNKGDNSNTSNGNPLNTKNEEEAENIVKPNFPVSPTNPTSPKYPSLYRNKSSPDGATKQEAQKPAGNTGNKMAMFQFSEDIPVV